MTLRKVYSKRSPERDSVSEWRTSKGSVFIGKFIVHWRYKHFDKILEVNK